MAIIDIRFINALYSNPSVSSVEDLETQNTPQPLSTINLSRLVAIYRITFPIPTMSLLQHTKMVRNCVHLLRGEHSLRIVINSTSVFLFCFRFLFQFKSAATNTNKRQRDQNRKRSDIFTIR